MTKQIKVQKSAEAFSAAVEEMMGGRNEIILAKYGAGVIGFTQRVFPQADLGDLYVQYNAREAGGRGPHFDAYQDYVDARTPWVGHYELRGAATLRAALLPEDLAASYFHRYPDASKNGEAAYDARRYFSQLALDTPGADISVGDITLGTGMVLPVYGDRPYIIHEITPTDDDEPGSFVKIIVPTKTAGMREDLAKLNYVPFDSFMTNRIAGTEVIADQEAVDGKEKRTPKIDRSQVRRRQSVRRFPIPYGGYDPNRTLD